MDGTLEIETDDGERLIGEAGQQLIRDWNLDLEEDRQRIDLFAINRRQPPKLVHRVIFSMPAARRQKRCWGPCVISLARNSGPSTDTRWCGIRTSPIPTCMSRSRRSVKRASG
jgi:hypothetical protein